jgi:SAM-dependent methyltransferase
VPLEVDLWSGDHKIPWQDPAFSRRMLAEHLSQEHDMASRRFSWIDLQVDWIHREILSGRQARVLDLGCGPGFYSHRLAAHGHRCHGIDFGPASVEYARQRTADRSGCDFALGDIRCIPFDGPYDLAMVLFGEMNTFPPAEILAILRRAHQSLAEARGVLLAEIQTSDAVERAGRNQPLEEQFESGLFSEHPYRCRTESTWYPEQQVAVETFTITPLAGGEAEVYRSTTKAWRDDELAALLEDAGFHGPRRRADWPCNVGSLALWSAER